MHLPLMTHSKAKSFKNSRNDFVILPLTKSCLAGFNRRRPPLLLAEILAHSPADTDKRLKALRFF